MDVKSSKPTIRERLKSDAFGAELRAALPRHLTPEYYARVAMTSLQANPSLAECTQASFFTSLLRAAQLGIEPDNRLAYLIPYGKEATLQIGYLGMIELAKRNGDVEAVYANLVYANEPFEVVAGLDRDIRHRVNIDPASRGDLVACYAVIRFNGGGFDFEAMPVSEVMDIGRRSRGYKKGPWQTDPGEMVKKTVLKRLLKRQTMTRELREAELYDADRLPGLDADPAERAKPAERNPIPTRESDAEAFELEAGGPDGGDAGPEPGDGEADAAFEGMDESGNRGEAF